MSPGACLPASSLTRSDPLFHHDRQLLVRFDARCRFGTVDGLWCGPGARDGRRTLRPARLDDASSGFGRSLRPAGSPEAVRWLWCVPVCSAAPRGSRLCADTPGLHAASGAPASSTPQPASTSLFGQPAQPQQQSTSLFGQPAQQQQQQQAPTSSLFGQQQPAQSTSLFGQPQQQQQQQSGGLFGGQQNNSLTVSQLGQPKPAQSFFGAPQQQQQQQNGQSQFGGYNSLAASQQPPPPPLKPEDLPVEQRIELIKNAWDPSSPSCRFKVCLLPGLSRLDLDWAC